MKTTRKTSTNGSALTALVLAGLTSLGSLNASAAGRVEERRGPAVDYAIKVRENVRRVVKELELTEAQQAQLREIFAAERQALLDLREDESLTVRQKLEALREIRRELWEAVGGILTPEQLEEWKAMRESQRTAWRERLLGQ
jgi:Spy/CpxP family protein refolding chaperone